MSGASQELMVEVRALLVEIVELLKHLVAAAGNAR